MWCAIQTENGIIVRRCVGFTPKNCVGVMPEDTPFEDLPFVDMDKNGSLFVCQKKKSAWLKEQIKNADVSE